MPLIAGLLITDPSLAGAVVIPHAVIVAAAALLGLVALALAWPVPVALSRASWPTRMPVIALLLWQAIGLAGGLSMIGALALSGFAVAPQHPWYVLLPAMAFTVYLLSYLAVTIVQVTRQRRRHLALLELLASPHPTRARTQVIDDAVPVAYCLPRGSGSVTVLSQGLLDRLDPDELVAVIAHERAHVEQRHDLLLLAFRAWRAALPWFPIAARAEADVAALVEMLADDHARREVRDEVLARAILAVGADGVPGAERAVSGSPRVSDRFRRLAA
ncbi:M56 family metallopeptidase [Microbacterium sp. NPDC057659]|uniref:M56 family metallopeptidase n=1 Tax=Microbacterium sp. NPDC057659 TaxID=3346198 RepID=UPI00366BFCDF